jgi:outer membrane murein-binding lipoprotein Lpp
MVEVTMMNKTATMNAKPKSKAEYEAEIDRYIADMEKMREDIVANRREIARLRAETHAVLTELKIA